MIFLFLRRKQFKFVLWLRLSRREWKKKSRKMKKTQRNIILINIWSDGELKSIFVSFELNPSILSEFTIFFKNLHWPLHDFRISGVAMIENCYGIPKKKNSFDWITVIIFKLKCSGFHYSREGWKFKRNKHPNLMLTSVVIIVAPPRMMLLYFSVHKIYSSRYSTIYRILRSYGVNEHAGQFYL